MSRYFPTLRGWVALLLATFGLLYFPVLRPALFVASGRGTFVAEPVTPFVWITGGILIVVCLIASVEAFRRGSRADKICACVAALLTVGLMFQYSELVVVSRRSPNNSLEPTGSADQSNAFVRFYFEPVAQLLR